MINYSKEKSNIDNVVTECFDSANICDEAEFTASLLKHANLSPWDGRDALKNFEQLFNFLAEITLSRKYAAEDTIRLSLLLYCHFFEWSEIFNLFYDLSKIAKGERAGNTIKNDAEENRDLYWAELQNIIKGELTQNKINNARLLLAKFDNNTIGINKKIKVLSEDNEKLGKLLEDLFDNTLRNGFSHNNYSFVNDGIRISNEVTSKEVLYSWDEINRLFNLTKYFASSLLITWRENMANLKNKHLKGKYCEYKITYGTNKRFKIEIINGSIPLGLYS